MSAPAIQKPHQAPQSFPKPEFTGAEAGLLEFPSSTSRTYNYFKPQKLRATVYEDVTTDVQPDPERHLTQGWLYGFADGPGGYPHDWTTLKSSNWHARNSYAIIAPPVICCSEIRRNSTTSECFACSVNPPARATPSVTVASPRNSYLPGRATAPVAMK